MSVHYRLEDRVAHIRLDDGKANALSFEMMEQLLAALQRADDEASAVLISGREGRFSAGFDLKVMVSGMDAAIGMLRRGAELFTRLYSFPKPVVMACTGHAVAGGALLLLTADRRLGARGDFKVGLNEVSIQMTLPRLGVELARDRLDPQRLTESVLFARLYAPSEAAEVGYLDEAVGGETLMAQAMDEAKALAKLPAAAFAGTKHRLREQTLARITGDLERDFAELAEAAR